MNTNSVLKEFSNRDIRVLSIIPGEPERVAFIFAKRQIASLQELGVVCETFYCPTRRSPWGLLENCRRLRERIKTFKPHLLHAHFGKVTAFTSLVATRLPVVVTYRGSDLNPNPDQALLSWAVDVFLSQISALLARRVICVSPQLKRRLWWGGSRATVVPSGVDTRVFFSRSRDEARSELGWERDELVVLFNTAGNRKNKRLDLALAAVDVARTLCGEIRFVALDGFVEPNVIPTFMNASDCLLVTSDWEGEPSVVKEALACNLPVVSVDVGDVRKLTARAVSSHVVERDPYQLGKALAEVLIGRERSNGSQAIRELTLEKIALRIWSVYKEALTM